MEPVIIKIGCYGIEVTLTDLELHALTPNRYGGGSITSCLHEEPDSETFEDENAVFDYNNAMNGIESMILAHAIAGIDVTTPAYKEGIETAVQGCANNI